MRREKSGSNIMFVLFCILYSYHTVNTGKSIIMLSDQAVVPATKQISWPSVRWHYSSFSRDTGAWSSG